MSQRAVGIIIKLLLLEARSSAGLNNNFKNFHPICRVMTCAEGRGKLEETFLFIVAAFDDLTRTECTDEGSVC